MFFANHYSQVSRLGSDDRAEGAMQTLRPGYRPIAAPLCTPGPLAEDSLFALQGMVGVAHSLVGFRQASQSRQKREAASRCATASTSIPI